MKAKFVARFQGTWASFVVVERSDGRFAVEQHDDHGDGTDLVVHGVFSAEWRARDLAASLAKHS